MENKKTASDFLKKVGLNMRKIHKTRKGAQTKVAKALNMAKVSYSIIERDQIGIPLKALFNISKNLDISPLRLLLENIANLLNKGGSNTEFATYHNVSPKTVRYHLKKLEIANA